MKLSYFIQPVHPVDKDYGLMLAENLESFVLADELGYEEAYVGEHFTDICEPIQSCLIFLARLIPVTKRIKLCSGVVNLPVYPPVMLAGQIALMDHLCEGRFIWGLGPGGQPSDVEVFGNREVDRNKKMIEVFDQIMEIWWGDPPYDIQGEFFHTKTVETYNPAIGQGWSPKPLTKPHPPAIITATAPNSHGITMAAERGWHPISCQYVQPHWAKTHLPKYLEGLRNAGKPANPLGWRVAKNIFVADDDKIAERYAKTPEGPYGFYYDNFLKKMAGRRIDLFAAYPDQPQEEITLQQSLETQVIAGSVNSVVDQLLELREFLGPFGHLIYTGHDWADPELGRRSMVLMTEQVLPRLNDALRDDEAKITARVKVEFAQTAAE